MTCDVAFFEISRYKILFTPSDQDFCPPIGGPQEGYKNLFQMLQSYKGLLESSHKPFHIPPINWNILW